MLFTEPSFLFLFLPVLLGLYFVTGSREHSSYGNALQGYYTCGDVYARGINETSLWSSWQDAVNLCTGLVAQCKTNTAAMCNLPPGPMLVCAQVDAVAIE